MVKVSGKDLIKLVLSVSLVIGAMLIGGCVGQETETPPEANEIEAPTQETSTPITKSITPQEAFNLIQENKDNPHFVIIDIRTPEEFAQEHIEHAINIDFRSENFREELDKLDKDKTYLIYSQSDVLCPSCPVPDVASQTLNMMFMLNFREVYNISGGLARWKEEGLPTI